MVIIAITIPSTVLSSLSHIALIKISYKDDSNEEAKDHVHRTFSAVYLNEWIKTHISTQYITTPHDRESYHFSL